MFGNIEKVLGTLKNTSAGKVKPIPEKKIQFVSIFEAIDKAMEAQVPDVTKDDLATQQKKLTEIAVQQPPVGAEEKEEYKYFGSSAQENFYAKTSYDPNTKKLLSIQIINSVDEEVANVTNDQDLPAAQIISDLVDQLRIDSVSFALLLDVGAVDLEPDVITPSGEGGAGGPMAPDTGMGPVGGGDDLSVDDEQPGPVDDMGDEEDEDKFLVGQKESKSAVFAPWAKSIKETLDMFETKEKAKESKVKLPEGKYQVIEKGKKVSLVANVITEGITSSKLRYLVSNEDVNVSVNTPDGNATVSTAGGQTSITVDSNGGAEQISVDASAAIGSLPTGDDAGTFDDSIPGGAIDDAALGAAAEPVVTGDIGSEEMPGETTIDSENAEGSFEEPPLEEEDEFEIPEGVNKGSYKVKEKKADGSFIVELVKNPKVLPGGKKVPKKDQRKEDKKVKKESKVFEGKQVVKIQHENGESPWTADPMQIKQVLTSSNSEDHVVEYIENGMKGVALLSQLQGVDMQVGPETLKVAILDPNVAAATALAPQSTEPVPITPAEAKIGREDTPASVTDQALPSPANDAAPLNIAKPAREGKIPDLVNKDPQDYIDELLEKHGLKEAETTPASREDAGGSASISKEGEGDLKMTGGINLDDKGGAPHSKTSTPASKEDDGGTASISKEGEGKLDTGEIDRKDKGGGPATAASGAAGASADKGPRSNTGTSGSAEGGPQGAADSNTSTSTLESYIAKLTKEMNEEKNPEIKKTISETITWLKAKGKK